MPLVIQSYPESRPAICNRNYAGPARDNLQAKQNRYGERTRRGNTSKRSLIAMTIAAMLSATSLASSLDRETLMDAPSTPPNPAETTSVNILTYDYAGLERADLENFLVLTHKILADTGLSIRVSLCRGSASLSCHGVAASRQVVVRIFARDAKSWNDPKWRPLGQAYADHHGGTMASVFVTPVRAQAADANVSWVMLLSYAAAHEVGHLLLGDQAHVPRGLMREHWDRSDYRAMAQGYLFFTDEQTRTLANLYGPVTAGPSTR